mmetsp:Transcript_19902/g.50627  ORF Transcript_19902/g.50627 Transcript_19902/m.50627 type:complete len:200 (-) Transcript_19902:2512-3111(-)
MPTETSTVGICTVGVRSDQPSTHRTTAAKKPRMSALFGSVFTELPGATSEANGKFHTMQSNAGPPRKCSSRRRASTLKRSWAPTSRSAASACGDCDGCAARTSASLWTVVATIFDEVLASGARAAAKLKSPSPTRSTERKAGQAAGGWQLAEGPVVITPACSTCTYRSIWLPRPSCTTRCSSATSGSCSVARGTTTGWR